MALLVNDGRRSGHLKWSLEALGEGLISGVILSPWHTPRDDIPVHRSAGAITAAMTAAHGTVLFDATSHGLLPHCPKVKAIE